jgi:hypothetical protein
MHALANNKMNLHCPSWASHQMTSNAQHLVFNVPNPHRSAKTLVVFMRNAGDILNFQADMTERTKSNLDNVQVQIGKDQLETMNRESHFWQALKRAFHNNITGIVTYKTYGKRFGGDGSAFLMAFDLESDDSDSFISGRSDRANIEVKITHSQQPATDIVYYGFLLHDRIVEIRPTGINVVQ